MLSKYKLNQLYFKDTQFANLMTRRIFNVLLIANPYDAFMLEDDGRIDEKIFNEYTSLSLRYPPRFSQVSTEEEALALIPKTSLSSDRSLQPDFVKLDSLVIAHQPWRGEYVPGPCTHRPSSHESRGYLKYVTARSVLG